MIGFDWVNYFGKDAFPSFYPPWTSAILKIVSWPLLIGLTISSFGIAALKRSNHPISLLISFFLLAPIVDIIFWAIRRYFIDGIAMDVLVSPFCIN